MSVLPALGAVLLLLLLGAVPARAQEAEASVGLTTAITRQANLEGRVMWMDATANLQRLSTWEGVSAIMEKCRQANINTIVVDVKPLSGHVLYPSSVAPRLKEWKGFQYPPDYDLMFTTMLEGKRKGIRVYASINVFSEAHKLLKSGPLYEKPEQQAIVYDVERTVIAPDGATWALAVGENLGPAQDQVVSYDPRWKDPKRLGPEDAAVVLQGETVTGIVDGALTDGGAIPVPADGHLLIGRGTGARWLMEHARVGEPLTYTAKEVFQPILEAPAEAVGGFVNPVNPESRAYALRVVTELVNRYALDGLVFDRMRYSSLKTDFSPLSRELFEKSLGKKLERFPQDIYAYSAVPGRPIIPGTYYKEWLEWRARNIRDFLQEARDTALRVRPGLKFGVYVGSWYEEYYDVGVNWGAEDFHPGYEWMTPAYNTTGYAGLLDWLGTGCYYPIARKSDARQLSQPEEKTVEAAAELSVKAVNDMAFVYGGLYLLDYQGRPDDFRKAVETALENSQGVMLFDLYYLEEYNWWNILSELFSTPRRAPHDVPGLQQAIRQTRKVLPAPPKAP